MMSVLDHADVSKMHIARSRVGRIGIGIDDWPLRRRSWRYHPFPASDLGFQKTIAENRYDRDRIEDENEQHHGVGCGRVNPVIGDGYHDLEANPVEQRRCPVELRVPWPPKPIGSTRRWRACLICLFDVIKILHLQSLSIWENSTRPSDWKRTRPHNRGPIAHGHVKNLAPSFPPPLHRALFFGSAKWAYFKSWKRPR